MALSIATIPALLFSADFPEIDITATTQDSDVVVVVSLGSTQIFTSTYRPYSGHVIVRGMNEIINEQMLAGNIQTTTVNISATYQGSTTVATTTAIYSRYHIFGITAQNFINSHFLRRGEVSQTTRTATETLRYYSALAAQETMTVVATGTDGTVQTTTVTTARQAGIVSINASYSAILALFPTMSSIAAYRISVEDKVAFYYVIDTPMYEFTFRNMFGYTEVCRLSGVFTKNFSTEKSFAICAGQRKQYDVTHEMTMSIETSAMNLLDVEIFVDMATSDSITYLGEPALVVEYECNPSSKNGSVNTASLEFEFVNRQLAVYIGESGRTFTNEFTNQYY